MDINTLLRSSPLRIESGKYIYFDYPDDVFTRPKKENWDRDSHRGCCFQYLQRVLEDEPKDSILLDIGCGNNDFEAITKRFKYVGVDFYPYSEVTIVCDLGKVLPIADQSCDIVFANSTLEHIPNPWDTVLEVYRILKPGGKFVGGMPFLIMAHQEPYDFVRFTEYGLRSVLQHAGFTHIEIEPMGNAYNVYFAMQRFFFRELMHSPLGHKNMWRAARLAEKLTRWQITLFKWLFKKSRKSTSFAEGLGFKAVKN